MSRMDLGSLSELSMLDLFRMEVETQATAMTEGLLALERDQDTAPGLRELMRAAHSLKGAARMVGRNAAVYISHAMEDCLVSVQNKLRPLSRELIDTLLRAVDVLGSIALVSDEALQSWEDEQKPAMAALVLALSAAGTKLGQPDAPESVSTSTQESSPPAGRPAREFGEQSRSSPKPAAASDRVVRVTGDNLDRLMALAGEALVTSRWLDAFVTDALRLKRLHHELGQTLETLRNLLPAVALDQWAPGQLTNAANRLAGCEQWLAERLTELDLFDRRFLNFSRRFRASREWYVMWQPRSARK